MPWRLILVGAGGVLQLTGIAVATKRAWMPRLRGGIGRFAAMVKHQVARLDRWLDWLLRIPRRPPGPVFHSAGQGFSTALASLLSRPDFPASGSLEEQIKWLHGESQRTRSTFESLKLELELIEQSVATEVERARASLQQEMDQRFRLSDKEVRLAGALTMLGIVVAFAGEFAA